MVTLVKLYMQYDDVLILKNCVEYLLKRKGIDERN